MTNPFDAFFFLMQHPGAFDLFFIFPTTMAILIDLEMYKSAMSFVHRSSIHDMT